MTHGRFCDAHAIALTVGHGLRQRFVSVQFRVRRKFRGEIRTHLVQQVQPGCPSSPRFMSATHIHQSDGEPSREPIHLEQKLT